jgi:hypothetical protein
LEDAAGAPVWARSGVAIPTCPKSYVTGESLALVEEFLIRRRLGGIRASELDARRVEAFLALEKVLEAEMNDGQHTRQSSR